MKTVVSAELDDTMSERLVRFVHATGLFKTFIVRRAIAEYIERCLREDASLRARFERYTSEDEARKKILTARGRPRLTVVK